MAGRVPVSGYALRTLDHQWTESPVPTLLHPGRSGQIYFCTKPIMCTCTGRRTRALGPGVALYLCVGE